MKAQASNQIQSSENTLGCMIRNINRNSPGTRNRYQGKDRTAFPIWIRAFGTVLENQSPLRLQVARGNDLLVGVRPIAWIRL